MSRGSSPSTLEEEAPVSKTLAMASPQEKTSWSGNSCFFSLFNGGLALPSPHKTSRYLQPSEPLLAAGWEAPRSRITQ